MAPLKYQQNGRTPKQKEVKGGQIGKPGKVSSTAKWSKTNVKESSENEVKGLVQKGNAKMQKKGKAPKIVQEQQEEEEDENDESQLEAGMGVRAPAADSTDNEVEDEEAEGEEEPAEDGDENEADEAAEEGGGGEEDGDAEAEAADEEEEGGEEAMSNEEEGDEEMEQDEEEGGEGDESNEVKQGRKKKGAKKEKKEDCEKELKKTRHSVTVSSIPANATIEDLMIVFKSFDPVGVEFQKDHSALLYVNDQEVVGKILNSRYPLLGGRKLIVRRSPTFLACVWEIPTTEQFSDVKTTLMEMFPNLLRVVHPLPDKVETCGFVELHTNDQESLDELLQNTQLEMFGSTVQIASADEFYKKFSVAICGLPFWESEMEAVVTAVQEKAKEIGCEEEVLVLEKPNQLGQLIFKNEEDAKKAFGLDDQTILEHKVTVLPWGQNPFYVTIHDIARETSEEELKSLFTDVKIIRFSYDKNSSKCALELKEESDQKKCLELHQTMLHGRRIVVLLDDKGRYFSGIIQSLKRRHSGFDDDRFPKRGRGSPGGRGGSSNRGSSGGRGSGRGYNSNSPRGSFGRGGNSFRDRNRGGFRGARGGYREDRNSRGGGGSGFRGGRGGRGGFDRGGRGFGGRGSFRGGRGFGDRGRGGFRGRDSDSMKDN